MKILYAARMARHDLLRACNFLATKVTKWDKHCDKMLHRLVSYINSTLDQRLYAWVGDTPEKIDVHLYADADFAGDTHSMKSTNGTFMELKGTNTKYPLAGVSKKQTAVS